MAKAAIPWIALLTYSGGEAISIDKLDIGNDAPRKARGATVPFTTLEAEEGDYQGDDVGPGSEAGTVAASASGRKAVLLAGEGDYVEWTLPAAANALSLRFSLPDAPGRSSIS